MPIHQPLATGRVVFAAANDGELGKMKRAGLDREFVVADMKAVAAVDTEGPFRGVAERRALGVAADGEDWVLAAYGGLSLPALGGELAGRRPADRGEAAALVATLTERLAGLADVDRTVFWVQAVAVARQGSIVASWDAAGSPGVLRPELVTNPDPQRWFAEAWFWPQFGRPSARLTPDEFASVDVGWRPLWAYLRAFFRQAASNG